MQQEAQRDNASSLARKRRPSKVTYCTGEYHRSTSETTAESLIAYINLPFPIYFFRSKLGLTAKRTGTAIAVERRKSRDEGAGRFVAPLSLPGLFAVSLL